MLAGRLTRLTFTRACVVAALALMAVVLLPGAARAAEVGVNSDITWNIPHADVDRSVAMMKDAGVRSIRVNANWSAVETNGKGVLNQGVLADYDYAVQAARRAGLDVLMPMADGVPYWASADPAKYSDGGGNHWKIAYKPRSFQDYADYTRFIVQRYAPMGVHAYEVWNEPNLANFWPSGVSASDYTGMLRAAYPAIKSADPSSTVVLGGLSRNDYPYLERLYAAGAGPFFDVAAVHPYSGSDPEKCWNEPGSSRKALDAFCGLEEIHATMAAHGDGGKAVWATEFGWSTYSGGVSQAQQAEYLTKGFRKLESYPWVTKAFWYAFRNVSWLHNDPTDWEANLGLVSTDYTPKPALQALKAYATAQAAGAGASGQGASSPAPSPRPSYRAPAPPRRRSHPRTTVSVKRAGRSVRAASAGRPSALALSQWDALGRVSGVRGGRVALLLTRWSAAQHRWVRVRRIVSALRAGAFSTRLGAPRGGLYRLCAVYVVPTGGQAASAPQVFRT